MTTRWYFQPIFDSYLLVCGVGLVLALLLLVRPRFGSANPRRRRVLLLLRAVVIFLLFLGMLRPSMVSTQTRPLSATLALVVDTSRSMEFPDMPAGTRWEAMLQTMENIQPALKKLAAELELQAYIFDKTARPVQTSEGNLQLPESPAGDETDIGRALDDVLRRESGKRLAGVVLLSDGAQRATDPGADANRSATQLARLNAPLYTVTYGKSRDQSQARDVEVRNLPDQFSVFVKNELKLNATVRVQGFVNQELPVQLMVEAPSGAQEVVGPQTIVAKEDRQEIDISFTYTPSEAGQYRLTVSVVEQPGERVTDNNSLSAFLNVREGGLRVLYLCGNIGWQEHKFIRRSIDESSDIRLDFFWVDSRKRRLWPIPLKNVLDDGYDVFILADVDSSALGKDNCAALAATIEEGTGLMMTGGRHSFGPGGYFDTELAKVLPVNMSRFERQDFDAQPRGDLHIRKNVQMLPASRHFIMRLVAEDDQQQTWRRLPPLRGANRFSQLSERGIVLAESSQREPLLVAGQYGLGRVLAFAGDTTFRWYRQGEQATHKRFWRQVILWLAQKEDDQQDEVRIRLDQRRFAPGSRIPFDVFVVDGNGDPVTDITTKAEVVDGEGRRQTLELALKGEYFSGISPALANSGDYTLEVSAARNSTPIGEDTVSFIVFQQDLELADPAANPSQMDMLATITSSVGGKSIAPEELPALLDELRAIPRESVTEYQSKWQLTDTLGDSWALFLGMVALLSIEWYLRKKWAMV